MSDERGNYVMPCGCEYREAPPHELLSACPFHSGDDYSEAIEEAKRHGWIEEEFEQEVNDE